MAQNIWHGGNFFVHARRVVDSIHLTQSSGQLFHDFQHKIRVQGQVQGFNLCLRFLSTGNLVHMVLEIELGISFLLRP